MWKILLAVAGFVATAGSAAEPPPISLAPGEAVVLHIGQNGVVNVERREAARPLDAFDKYSVARLVAEAVPANATVLPGHVIQAGEGPTPAAIARDSVRISLRQIAGKTPHDTLLIVENGYDRAFRYRASMTRNGRTSATDVCLVIPGKHSYEHWPFGIERIDLTALRLAPFEPERGLICE